MVIFFGGGDGGFPRGECELHRFWCSGLVVVISGAHIDLVLSGSEKTLRSTRDRMAS